MATWLAENPANGTETNGGASYGDILWDTLNSPNLAWTTPSYPATWA
ncbi:unannotated protein [freshwater metagenome]|uniref:Unannotated protein n=1 Tax=freshwater metagenome TaxID=449393 RepID=A0A6J7CBV5_9ZZZZ